MLNLPEEITFTNGNSTKFFYSAEGEKLRAVHKTSGSTTQVDYCDNIIYEVGEQKYLLNQEGYFDLAAGGYRYYLKDHLGNNRVVITQSGAVEQTTHYYPYGGTFASSTTGQPYKYNGKELDIHNGLNWYDYGARHYDLAIARWTTQDPLAGDRYSTGPYIYTSNNPTNKIDIDGMIDDWVQDQTGEILWDSNATSKETTSESRRYLGPIVVVFNGFLDERLGTKKPGDFMYDPKKSNEYIDGAGAKTAKVTVYGPRGAHDIQEYIGFTMSSNFKKFGAIADGEYDVTYRTSSDKVSKLPKNYAVNNKEPVDCINGINPSPKEFNPCSGTQKDAIYIHRTNMSGWAGGSVSTGCLLIYGQEWNRFEQQIGKNNFKLILTRK